MSIVREESAAPGVLLWTLDHPQRRNVLDPLTLGWMVSRCSALRGEVVILTGAGEGVFSAGFDLRALPRLAAEDPGALPDSPLIAVTGAIARADATFIAAINGPAIGAAVELVLSCDLRIAAPTMSLMVPAAKLGVVYHAAGLVRLRAALGASLCRRLILLGETISAEEALATGAIERIVERDALLAAAMATARALSAGAPRSLRAHRALLRLLDQGAELPPAALVAHHEARVAAYAEADLEAAHRRALGRET
ncbi:MAG: enoyl-CoA hydratase/isomerase family protein [Nannocystis sp.]|nr:enoyl-CoA hydratase/isomerase family protein [Nannocystis sp.]